MYEALSTEYFLPPLKRIPQDVLTYWVLDKNCKIPTKAQCEKIEYNPNLIKCNRKEIVRHFKELYPTLFVTEDFGWKILYIWAKVLF